MALETVPKDLRHLRACLLCSLVKTIDQFEYDGCDNCESYLQMKGNREMVYECTSSSFDGQLQARCIRSICDGSTTSRCGEGAEKQRSDVQIQRHSSEVITLTVSSLCFQSCTTLQHHCCEVFVI
uniref:SPT4 homolog, DSIF elongation factor subunit n=1 Tax=Amphiprion ocellaris TaxID=80972 RepID=A0AAQ5Z1G3_AMPOC